MRVRPPRPIERRLAQRRPHVLARSSEAEPSADRAVERRHRAAGPPEDRATYGCACGCVFTAAVSTTVACPECGAPQAW